MNRFSSRGMRCVLNATAVTLIVSLSFVGNIIAQRIELNRIEFGSNKVVVHFDLSDSIAGRSYIIRMYSSVDGFLNPLVQITGDSGFDVRPGENKKIIWDAATELGHSFEGKVSLEIRCDIYIPFVRFDRFEDYKRIARGRKYNITWTGGSTQNILIFDLYRGKRKVTSFPNIANVGHAEIRLPLNVKPGDGYHFQISDSKNRDEVAFTGAFSVRRKVPLALKVAPVVVVAAIVHVLVNWPSVDRTLPDPIEPQ